MELNNEIIKIMMEDQPEIDIIDELKKMIIENYEIIKKNEELLKK